MNMNVNYRQNKAGQGHTQCNDTSEAMYGNAMGSAMGINACKATQWKITQRANLWQCDGQCNGPQMLGCVHCDLQGRHAEEDYKQCAWQSRKEHAVINSIVSSRIYQHRLNRHDANLSQKRVCRECLFTENTFFSDVFLSAIKDQHQVGGTCPVHTEN